MCCLKIRAESNTRLLSSVQPARQPRRQKATASLIETQMRRGQTNPCADEHLIPDQRLRYGSRYGTRGVPGFLLPRLPCR
jgi:hypothetical protein